MKGITWLEFSWLAYAPRLVKIHTPPEVGSKSTLAKQLQHVLRQLALVEVKQEGFDRVVEFGLAKRPGANIEHTLVLEIMGRHSNVLLLDKDRRVITLGRQVRSNQSRIRPIGTGDQYLPPPPLKGIKPSLDETFGTWRKRLCLAPTSLKEALKSTYQGISPSLTLQIAGEDRQNAKELLKLFVDEISEEKWQMLFDRWSLWLKKLEEETFCLNFNGPTSFRVWSPKESRANESKGLSLDLGKYYRSHLEEKGIENLNRRIVNKLIQLKTNENNILNEQQNLLRNASQSKFFQEEADELLCSPSLTKKTIEKAQALYRKAKKLRRSTPAINERICYHQNRLGMINESETFLEEIISNKLRKDPQMLSSLCELYQDIEELLSASKKNSNPAKKRKKDLPSPLELTTKSGLIIQVGRNHRQNDWISLRKAKTGDLWFHAQECPGSHVVLKASASQPEEEDLQFAADLAAFFSRAKGNQRVPVVMVPTDHLQRIPGTMPGTVRHRDAKVCWGVPSRARKHICHP